MTRFGRRRISGRRRARKIARRVVVESGTGLGAWRVVYRLCGRKIFVDLTAFGRDHAIREGRRVLGYLMEPVAAGRLDATRPLRCGVVLEPIEKGGF